MEGQCVAVEVLLVAVVGPSVAVEGSCVTVEGLLVAMVGPSVAVERPYTSCGLWRDLAVAVHSLSAGFISQLAGASVPQCLSTGGDWLLLKTFS